MRRRVRSRREALRLELGSRRRSASTGAESASTGADLLQQAPICFNRSLISQSVAVDGGLVAVETEGADLLPFALSLSLSLEWQFFNLSMYFGLICWADLFKK